MPFADTFVALNSNCLFDSVLKRQVSTVWSLKNRFKFKALPACSSVMPLAYFHSFFPFFPAFFYTLPFIKSSPALNASEGKSPGVKGNFGYFR